MFRWVFRVAEDVGSTAVKGDAWHHRSDALTSAAAFVGITIALVGGPGWESADDWAALFASFVIVYNGVGIFRPAFAELMDAAPDAALEKQVREVASAVPGVSGLDKCRVRKMGLDYYVDLEILVDGDLTVWAGHALAHTVQDALRAANPRIARVLVHVEPLGAEHS